MPHLIVEADGGSRGNPGVAGYGALLRDAHSKQVLRELAAPIGTASNNVAEYTGLIAGLTAVAELDQPTQVTVRMDSKLVVEQMSGRWKIKHADMQTLAAQAREQQRLIEQRGGTVSYMWVPRERNKDADALSNEGMDGHHVDRVPHAHEDPQDPDPDAGSVDHALGAAAARNAAKAAISPHHDAGTPCVPEDLAWEHATAAAAIRVVFVRHGESEATAEGRIDGRGGCDPVLTPQGQAQSVRCAQGVQGFLGVDHAHRAYVITSGLRRTRAITDALHHHGCAPATTDVRWEEQGMGDWDGRTLSDIAAVSPDDLAKVRTEDHAAPPGGESFYDVQNRAWEAFVELVRHARTHGHTSAVVVSHRTPIVAVLAVVLGMSRQQTWRLAIDLASLTSLVVYADGEVTVEFVNDTRHLA